MKKSELNIMDNVMHYGIWGFRGVPPTPISFLHANFTGVKHVISFLITKPSSRYFSSLLIPLRHHETSPEELL